MLRKLMKYELRATARIMLPLYLAVLGLAAVLWLLSLWSGAVSHIDLTIFDPVSMIVTIVSVAFIAALIAVPIAAVVLMIVRFKTNLLSDEGYVMFTLPVSPHQLVWSKLLTSAVWFIGAAVVDGLGILFVSAGENFFIHLWNGFRDLFSQLTAYYAVNGALFLAELAVLILLACFSECLEFYCPMAIGHSFARHKVLLSVVFYFVIQAATQAAAVILITAGLPFMGGLSISDLGIHPVTLFHGTMWAGILVTVVYGGVLYALTIRMLRRRLNLE